MEDTASLALISIILPDQSSILIHWHHNVRTSCQKTSLLEDRTKSSEGETEMRNLNLRRGLRLQRRQHRGRRGPGADLCWCPAEATSQREQKAHLSERKEAAGGQQLGVNNLVRTYQGRVHTLVSALPPVVWEFMTPLRAPMRRLDPRVRAAKAGSDEEQIFEL